MLSLNVILFFIFFFIFIAPVHKIVFTDSTYNQRSNEVKQMENDSPKRLTPMPNPYVHESFS